LQIKLQMLKKCTDFEVFQQVFPKKSLFKKIIQKSMSSYLISNRD